MKCGQCDKRMIGSSKRKLVRVLGLNLHVACFWETIGTLDFEQSFSVLEIAKFT